MLAFKTGHPTVAMGRVASCPLFCDEPRSFLPDLPWMRSVLNVGRCSRQQPPPPTSEQIVDSSVNVRALSSSHKIGRHRHKPDRLVDTSALILEYLQDHPEGVDGDSLARSLRLKSSEQAGAACRRLRDRGYVARRRVNGKLRRFAVIREQTEVEEEHPDPTLRT